MVVLKMFGTPQVRVSKRWETMPLDKSSALLVYVATHPNGVSRGTLATLLWSDTDDSRARANLRQLLTRVRRQVWSAALEIGEDFLFWRGDSDFALFWKSLSGLNLETFAPEFLEGFLLEGAAEFMDWLELERQTIRNAWREAGLQQAKQLAPSAALEVLRQMLRVEPLCEEALQGLLKTAQHLGQPELGRSAYTSFASALKTELALEPLPETRALLAQLESAKPEPAPKQVRLPASATPFIGREAERSALEQRLEAGARCISLLGAGGMGKTRLALRVASDWQDSFADGAVFASKVGLQGEAAFADAILAGLQVTTRQANPSAQLLTWLESRQMLLVLDNLEFDLPASAALVGQILERCPQVRILTTSRERLGIHAEEVFEVGMLTASAAENLFVAAARRADSRLSLIESDQAVVQRIAKHCGFMPLALELAASWAAVLSLPDLEREVLSSLDELESRFSDTPERHKSIRAVFGQTWQRLDPRLRRTLGWLAPLEGGFSLAMARGIAGATLRDVEALIARSLLGRNGQRYAIHELLRQFVLEQPEADTQAAQDWMMNFVEELQKNRRSPTTLSQLQEELINIKAVLWMRLTQQNTENLRLLVLALDDVYDTRGLTLESAQIFSAMRDKLPEHHMLAGQLMFIEGSSTMRLGDTIKAQQLFTQALERISEPRLQARTLGLLGQLHMQTGRLTEAETSLEKSLELFAGVADVNPIYVAEVHNTLSACKKRRNDYEKARQHLQTAISLYQQGGSLEGSAIAHMNLANVLEAQNELEAAKTTYEKCLTEFKLLGHTRAIGVVLNNLSVVQRRLGDTPSARTSAEQSLHIRREINDKRGVAVVLQTLAQVDTDEQQFSQANQRLLESIRLAFEVNAMPVVMEGFFAYGLILEQLGETQQAHVIYQSLLEQPSIFPELKNQIEPKMPLQNAGVSLPLVELLPVLQKV